MYGSYIYGIKFLDENSQIIYESYGELVYENLVNIENMYVAEIKKSKYSLLFPLGAKAKLSFKADGFKSESIEKVILIDINGKEWSAGVEKKRQLGEN